MKRDIKKRDEGRMNICRFRHPLRNKRVVRFDLGDDASWRENLRALNAVWRDPAKWRDLPETTPSLIRKQWLDEQENTDTTVSDAKLADRDEVAAILAERDAYRNRAIELQRALDLATAKLDDLEGEKYQHKEPKSLETARLEYLEEIADYSDAAKKQVDYSLGRFVREFPDTMVDKFNGEAGEKILHKWLIGLKSRNVKKSEKPRRLKGASRNFVRVCVLNMLENAGVKFRRKKIKGARKTELKKDKENVRYLSREESALIVNELKSPFKELFQLQVAVGLRPTEMLTIKRGDFTADYAVLSLSPLGDLGLKTGVRKVQIPNDLRPFIEWKLRASSILFPDPSTRKAWNAAKFCRQFSRRLKAAATATGVTMPMDSRIGRRTAATLLFNAGHSADQISAALGNSAAVLRKNYVHAQTEKLDTNQNVVGTKPEGAAVLKEVS